MRGALLGVGGEGDSGFVGEGVNLRRWGCERGVYFWLLGVDVGG